MQTDLQRKLHVAIIMDGNGRWAVQRGQPRAAGHRAGVCALREVVAAAAEQGIGTLTVYAFSADNWRRPPLEVATLMGLAHRYIERERAALVDDRVRLTVIGRRDRLPSNIVAGIERAQSATAAGDALHLRIALDYSSRDAIVAAASDYGQQELTRERLSRRLCADHGPSDIDLLIRTGGEKRLSDFLLWESAYAELYFTDCLWPDFGARDLLRAVRDFRGRERRFGRLPSEMEAAIPPGSANLPGNPPGDRRSLVGIGR